MILLYGLGNNETKYYHTKHNIGRKIIEEVVTKLKGGFVKKKSYYSYTHNNEYVFIYSDGYMNTSGKALLDFVSYHKIPDSSTLLIIHDDSDQYEGMAKLLPRGGSGGHHGINSIYSSIVANTPQSVWRLKVGIRPVHSTSRSETFVLSSLSKADYETIQHIAEKIVEILPLMNDQQWSKAQTLINTKKSI